MSQFRDNTSIGRYEYDVAGVQSVADYKVMGGVRIITHVETPAAARGQGYAAALMAGIVEHARAGGLKLRATCPYAVTYFQRHPDTADVLA